MSSYILDALIALCLTQSIGICYSPELPRIIVYKERSVWGNYKGLYKLQKGPESCSRLGTCDGIKAQLTWAPVLLKSKVSTTANKEK